MRSKPCSHCGGPKPPGQGRKLCDACQETNITHYSPDPCLKCGGPKPPGIGRRMCDECVELAEWQKAARAKVKRRKVCEGCGGPKGPGLRRRLCDRCKAKRAAKVRICQACEKYPTPYPLARLCVICKLESEKNRRVYQAERNRIYRLTRKPTSGGSNPESHRMWERMKREQEGKALPPVSEEAYAKRYGNGWGKKTLFVPVEPLRPYVLEALADLEDERGQTSAVELARRCKVSEKRVREIVHGEREDIALLVADRICTTLGVPFSWLYEDVEGEMAA